MAVLVTAVVTWPWVSVSMGRLAKCHKAVSDQQKGIVSGLCQLEAQAGVQVGYFPGRDYGHRAFSHS